MKSPLSQPYIFDILLLLMCMTQMQNAYRIFLCNILPKTYTIHFFPMSFWTIHVLPAYLIHVHLSFSFIPRIYLNIVLHIASRAHKFQSTSGISGAMLRNQIINTFLLILRTWRKYSESRRCIVHNLILILVDRELYI